MRRRDSDRQYPLPLEERKTGREFSAAVERKVVAFSDVVDERERLEALRRLRSENIFDTSRYDKLLK